MRPMMEVERGQDSGRKWMFAAVHPVSYHVNGLLSSGLGPITQFLKKMYALQKTLIVQFYCHEICKSITIMQLTFLYIVHPRSIRHARLL